MLLLLIVYFLSSDEFEFLHDPLYALAMLSVLLLYAPVAGDHVEDKVADKCAMQLQIASVGIQSLVVGNLELLTAFAIVSDDAVLGKEVN